jgi:hypothetical protein
MTGTSVAGLVFIGIIDDGIAFAHERFRRVHSGTVVSRVEHWWLQDGPWRGPGTIWPGCELQKTEIDQLLKDCSHAGVVDEDEVYRRAGLTDFRRVGHKSAAWRAAHGTHVMDLACGFDEQSAPTDRPIICVQLPVRATSRTSGGSLFSYVSSAIGYIVRRAHGIAQAQGIATKIVVNLSYGRLAGPHDGTSPLEHELDRLVGQYAACNITLRVVLPAGNGYLSRCHAHVSFGSIGESKLLEWRIQPDDRTPSFLEIWLPSRSGGSASRVKLTVTSPTGVARTIRETPPVFDTWQSGGRIYGRFGCWHMPAPTDRNRFLVMVRPTADLDRTRPLAPAGTWRIELENEGLTASEVVDAWVQRDDSLYGFPLRGRQSYFKNSCYRRHDDAGREIETDDPACAVLRSGTLNAIATGREPIVMGGFLGKEMVPAKYSAAGPILRTDPYRPDAMSISEDSRAHRGVLAAGSRSGSVVTMGGTSVAAPRIARSCADDLAGGGKGDRVFVQDLAKQAEASYPAGTPSKPDSKRGGAGRIKLPPLNPSQRHSDM